MEVMPFLCALNEERLSGKSCTYLMPALRELAMPKRCLTDRERQMPANASPATTTTKFSLTHQELLTSLALHPLTMFSSLISGVNTGHIRLCSLSFEGPTAWRITK